MLYKRFGQTELKDFFEYFSKLSGEKEHELETKSNNSAYSCKITLRP